MNYLDFKSWKSTRSKEMTELSGARSDDIFIFTRYTEYKPLVKGNQILFSENIDEILGYIRHIFLYDILNDVTDDLSLDLNSSNYERQQDAVALLSFWYKLGKIDSAKDKYINLKKLCNEFNFQFQNRENIEYEIQILNGAEELRYFLIEKYCDIDKDRLADICSNEAFNGKQLKEFIDNYFAD